MEIKIIDENDITLYRVEDRGVVQEFGTYKEAEEFVSYTQNPKYYLKQMNKRLDKERELEFKEAKEKILFTLRGVDKYYYAFQCAKFEKNIIEYGYSSYATKSSVAKEGLLFDKYKITLGHPYGYDLKRFNNKDEMLGFVIGYNECISFMKYHYNLEVA